jgi:uncharacterized protein (TIGR02145 family)
MIKYLIFLLCISTSLSAQVMLPAYQGVQGAAISSAITTPVVPVTGAGGRIWMDRNLGATQVATSYADPLSYGSLYQWGRGSDGHELITWASGTSGASVNGTNSTLTDTPSNTFILSPLSNYDWRSTPDDNLWQGVAGINNPCPSGYRLPTKEEWDDEIQNWNSQDAAGALASPLKLPMAGSRSNNDGAIATAGNYGFYWSSTVGGTVGSGIYANYLVFVETHYAITSTYGLRSSGYSVRCIKH